MKTFKKFIPLLIFFGVLYVLSLFSNNDSPKVVLADLYRSDIIGTHQTVKNWIDSLEHQEGIFFARKQLSDISEEYYLYTNKLQIGDLLLKPERDGKGLNLDIEIRRTGISDDHILIIKTRNKRPEYIMVNNKKIYITSIPEI